MNKFSRRFFIALSSTVLSSTMMMGLVSTHAFAESTKQLSGVVELYTSQGCSSCPPADAALEKYIERDDVLALAFHVDYWDYLGWKDTLASADNTARQYAYRKTFKARSVYTPQAIINGRNHVVGSRGNEIEESLEKHAAQGHNLSVPIGLSHNDARIQISVDESVLPLDQDVKLVLVYYKDATTVDIKRGENTGREITYRNTVVQTQTLGMWDGKAMSVEMPLGDVALKGADGCAVLLQATTTSGSPGAILGAAILPRARS